MREKLQNLSYNNKYLGNQDYKVKSLNLKLLKNINSVVSYSMSALWSIAIIEFIRFCFDLYSYVH